MGYQTEIGGEVCFSSLDQNGRKLFVALTSPTAVNGFGLASDEREVKESDVIEKALDGLIL